MMDAATKRCCGAWLTATLLILRAGCGGSGQFSGVGELREG